MKLAFKHFSPRKLKSDHIFMTNGTKKNRAHFNQIIAYIDAGE